MTDSSTSRGARLEALLDEAFELEGPARERFLDTVEPELRKDLDRLIAADAGDSVVDGACFGLVEAAAALSGQRDAFSTITAGQHAGSYRLLRLLGEGGMASVWLGERIDGSFSHRVAVKCLKSGLATPESRARFLREQQIMAQLQHPYIARLYDVGVSADNVPFIVMEWIDGVPLTRWCDERRLGIAQRLRLFLKVCSAVAHAHQNLVVHRDLKPGNILVGNDGEPRLLDFGIAKILDESAPVTRSGMHMLTPEYAAPEQFIGGMITTTTDVYMLGAVLYELLCGLRPRHFSRNPALADATITAPSEALPRLAKAAAATNPHDPVQLAAQRDNAPERLCRSLRGDLDTIALKALQADPDRRYSTVQALRDDIERYLRHQPIAARKEARMYRFGKLVQRHAVAAAMGALVLSALITATTVSIYQARRAQTEARRALATKEFLVNLFEVSDSGSPRDQVPTTQALLQDGAKRIRGAFGDAPEVKFDLLLMLGRVQRHLGQYASSEPLLREALAIADARFSPDSAAWLDAHSEWAEVLHVQSHLALAAQELDAAVAKHRQAGARDSDALTEAISLQGNIYSSLGQFDRAIATSQQAVAMAIALHGEHHAQVQKAQSSLGKVLMRAGRYEQAEVVARANVLLSGELFGEHHARYADSLAVLADALSAQNKDAESEQLARQALAIQESVYDRPNAALINTLSSLVDTLYNQDKLDETEAILRRWLKAQTQLTGPEDPSTTPILLNLGLVAKRRQDYAGAERVLRQALAIYAKRPDAIPSAQQSDTWRALAQALSSQHRMPESYAAVQDALSIDRKSPTRDNDHRVGMDLVELARMNLVQGDAKTALARIDEALNALGEHNDAGDPDWSEAVLQKASVLDRLARQDEARDLLVPLIASLRTTGTENADHDRLSRALSELGRAQSQSGDATGALANWKEALALQQAIKPPDAGAIADLQGLIAQAHDAPHAAHP